MRGEYNTKQRKLILAYLARHKEQHLTAEDIAAALNGQVGQTTVYRTLDRLAADNRVIKYEIPGGKSAYYQYEEINKIAGSHCHLFCVKCGDMTDLNCHFVRRLSDHIQEDHRFKLDDIKTVFYGVCERCG